MDRDHLIESNQSSKVNGEKRNTKKRYKKILIVILSLLLIGGAVGGFFAYKYFWSTPILKSGDFYLRSNYSKAQAFSALVSDGFLNSTSDIENLANALNKKKVFPGRYIINKEMSLKTLLDKISRGSQNAVKVVIPSVREKEKLAGIVSKYIEADSLSILKLFSDKKFIDSLGFTIATFPALFIPQTYEVYWDLDAKEIAKKLLNEYNTFWDEERLKKCVDIGFNQFQVATIASIIAEESTRMDDLPIMAGVYINRFRKGIKLEACPTAKYAAGDWTIRRVLDKHLKIDSPYNTYMYKGLPPGPIIFPETKVIDAVLNYKKSDYMFFCAHWDFSGRHKYSKTLAEHNDAARKYRAELNRRKILK